MSFLRRNKKTKEDEDSLPLVDKKEDKNDKNKPVSTTQCVVEWGLTAVFFVIFYYLTFSDKERADHKQQMDNQLAALADQFAAQTAALNTQLDGLYQQLFAAEHPGAVETQGAEAVPDVTPPSTEAIQAEIAETKAELSDEEKKVAAFCGHCTFYYSGLQTSCGARRDFLVSRYNSDYRSATLAVIEWDKNCAPGWN